MDTANGEARRLDRLNRWENSLPKARPNFPRRIINVVNLLVIVCVCLRDFSSHFIL